MYGYIYLTINIQTQKKYIGQHKAAKFEPEKYIGSGIVLQEAIRKYGGKNFECHMLDSADDLDELNYKERYGITKFDAVKDPMFYNLAEGGYLTSGYNKLTSSEKMSRNLKISNHLKDTFAKVSDDYYDRRADKKRKTLAALSEEEKGRRHKVNSVAQHKYQQSLSQEQKKKQ